MDTILDFNDSPKHAKDRFERVMARAMSLGMNRSDFVGLVRIDGAKFVIPEQKLERERLLADACRRTFYSDRILEA